ncbi:efflux RND transporter periplasmic adaptor subunit [Marinomonas mediterranea]|uniref:Efflux transporter, RND family, MFP subunit n=1 Tax=Marinomonas mediterranea (strain ATCC 700492 / JCM 21426 / NBRC 103028 / MMB-1) TaxID=717774 RepID=F2JZZ7_MARM1|nr:efflux RND transporter periplasmic adaptor subunit [Marinomonas mediterranea]ADZ92109.1 efflux transporter, RND family, MFP subunit [Marinomonas mediterranea MMB-1]WCN10070.1 efflux RND transporter periplasmic adaptor subunit [Marinomonas mediterranea]WCN14121.1 efflux RND transporter periplasmic adaptor subunit [Marinomonas mediterranea]WCN18176.1 efflux RND transporter periplasmic adaptor subunit [Marinomonas mediterranea MMB-1]
MKLKNVLAIIAGVGAILLAVIVVDELEPKSSPKKEASANSLPPTTVLSAVPTYHRSHLSLLATTAKRWPVKIKATSNAQLIWLDPLLEPGQLVKKGTPLVRLDTSNLASNLAQAKSELAQSKLNLEKTQHQQAVILKTRKSQKSSPFARLEPQISAAKAELSRSEYFYASAKKSFEEATIVAPFDAIITHRYVSPGEWLEAGQILFELASSDSLNITLPISELNWRKAQQALKTNQITVNDRAGNQWPAHLRFISPEVDPITRQRQITLSVTQPYQSNKPLLANQQVKVTLNLSEQPNIVALPISSLTRDGFIWTLNENNRLNQEKVTLIEQRENQIFVRFDNNSNATRDVVVYPLISMLPGKQVSPQPLNATLSTEKTE